MAKNNWNDYSATAASNTDIGGIDIDENCVPSNINDALRTVLAHTADVVSGTVALSSVNIDGGSITGITDLAVADGGTGASTLTANGVLFGNGTSAIGATAVGTSGQVLTSNGSGSAPTFQAAATTYTHPNHSGEVTSSGDGATVIASNVVDEDNLKVSNSPSDGYILTARSGNTGGMTWEAAAGGGASDIDGLSDAKKLGTSTYGIGSGALAAATAALDGGRNTAIGADAGGGTKGNGAGNDPFDNTFIGHSAGYGVNQTGSTASNVAIGRRAMWLHTGCVYNVIIGKDSGAAISTGSSNTGVGEQSLVAATTASLCTNIGRLSGRHITTGSKNTSLGYESGILTTTGVNCTSLGYQAMPSSASASNEVTLGDNNVTKLRIPGINFTVKDSTATEDYVLTVDANGEAGWEAAGGGGATNINGLSDALTNSNSSTIGLGNQALVSDDGSANNNIALGGSSLTNTTSGSYNTAIGSGSGTSNSTGEHNTFLGANSGQLGTLTGSFNTAIGSTSLRKIQGAASDNIGCGYWSGYNLTTGLRNIILGREAMYTATTASGNVAIGRNAGNSLTTASSNVIIGQYAGYNATVEDSSVFIGNQAGRGTGGTTSYGYNVAIGKESLYSHNGVYGNVAIGPEAGKQVTTGNSNTTIGYLAGSAVTTGQNNSFLGLQSGDNLTTGSNNIILGNGSDASSVGVSNEITLGNSSISTLRCQVQTISSLSDRRDKKDIEELPLGIDFINTLKPVKFTWNMRDGAKVGEQEAGFIAQDLDKAQIDADAEDYLSLVLKNNPEKLEASYGKLVPVLVKAVQELSAEVATLKKGIENG